MSHTHKHSGGKKPKITPAKNKEYQDRYKQKKGIELSKAERELATLIRSKMKKKPRGRPFPKGVLSTTKPFLPGNNANPAGRPRTDTLGDAYRAALEEVDPEQAKTNAAIIAASIVLRAKLGNVQAAAEVGDRSFGKPRQAVEILNTANPLLELVASMNKISASIGRPEGMGPHDDEND